MPLPLLPHSHLRSSHASSHPPITRRHTHHPERNVSVPGPVALPDDDDGCCVPPHRDRPERLRERLREDTQTTSLSWHTTPPSDYRIAAVLVPHLLIVRDFSVDIAVSLMSPADQISKHRRPPVQSATHSRFDTHHILGSGVVILLALFAAACCSVKKGPPSCRSRSLARRRGPSKKCYCCSAGHLGWAWDPPARESQAQHLTAHQT